MKKITDKGKEIFGLNKIPDKELLKEARIEIGKLNSYIDELESKITQFQDEIHLSKLQLSDDIKCTILHNKIKNQSKELKNLNDQVKKYKDKWEDREANLSKTYEARIQKLTRERDDLSSEVHKLNIKVSMLQNQLISIISPSDNGI